VAIIAVMMKEIRLSVNQGTVATAVYHASVQRTEIGIRATHSHLDANNKNTDFYHGISSPFVHSTEWKRNGSVSAKLQIQKQCKLQM